MLSAAPSYRAAGVARPTEPQAWVSVPAMRMLGSSGPERSRPPDWASRAAAYAFGIARNHPFVDGNKRTSYMACRMFLILNGFDLAASKEDKHDTFLRLAAGEMSESELAGWIRERIVSLSS
jgi:prophage maintenance system killer protein